MSLLVTGGTGVIGGALARALRAEGREVRAPARPGSDARALEAVGAIVLRGDVADPAAMRAAAEGCEVVHSLAVSPRMAGAAVSRAVNVDGARNAASTPASSSGTCRRRARGGWRSHGRRMSSGTAPWWTCGRGSPRRSPGTATPARSAGADKENVQ